TLAVYGPDYREPLLEYSDMDMDGDYARESITVQIPRSGRYYVKVGAYSGSTTPFDLVTSFALYGQDLPGDPDGVSASARPVSLGDCRAPGGFRDMLDGAAGDYRDWFRFQPEESGLLLVSVIADTGGDLILSAHGSDDPLESELARSDSDYDGNYGNERVVVDCEPGHPILIQVQGYGTYVADQYTLRLSFMPIESDARSGER
ncbi:hypothetical protein JW921_04785, partial [Candidatus Fermentibacterales bacterium]|nr:hypothetical protein [Candidatus Fermentibacterales bacterium]